MEHSIRAPHRRRASSAVLVDDGDQVDAGAVLVVVAPPRAATRERGRSLRPRRSGRVGHDRPARGAQRDQRRRSATGSATATAQVQRRRRRGARAHRQRRRRVLRGRGPEGDVRARPRGPAAGLRPGLRPDAHGRQADDRRGERRRATPAGFLLSQMCDLCVAAEHARFAITEVKVGRGAPWAAPLPWLVPPRIAMELLVTGEPMTAARAYDVGLVNRVVPDGRAARRGPGARRGHRVERAAVGRRGEAHRLPRAWPRPTRRPTRSGSRSTGARTPRRARAPSPRSARRGGRAGERSRPRRRSLRTSTTRPPRCSSALDGARRRARGRRRRRRRAGPSPTRSATSRTSTRPRPPSVAGPERFAPLPRRGRPLGAALCDDVAARHRGVRADRAALAGGSSARASMVAAMLARRARRARVAVVRAGLLGRRRR